MSTVTIKGLGKIYPNGQRAVKDVDLQIADGEMIVVVGPSGCGKSTLLRMVAGLEQISEGTLEIDGECVNTLEPAERNIAMVFQNYALYPHMSVYQNMAYGLKNRRVPRELIKQRVTEVAKLLELSHLLERRPGQLSGGQRQRVAMGRAIVRNPKVFLFDEPLSNLDAKLRVQMRIEIRKLQQKLGVTSIYVTHDQVEAMTLADRLVVINKGVVEQIGSPMELYSNPATPFVAGFIGSPAMNLLTGQVNKQSLQLGSVEITLSHSADYCGEVVVGLRPEHLLRTGEELSGAVELVEALGADTLVHLRLADEQTLVTRLPGTAVIEPGTSLQLGFDKANLHLFRADTGARLFL